MGTNNFYNHTNGIFVLPLTDFDQMKEWMEEDEAFEGLREERGEEGITDEDVCEQLQFENDRDMEEFLKEQLGYFLEKEGYSISLSGDYEGKIYNPKGKLLAEVAVVSGYYEGAQLIVETDPYELLQNEHDLFYNDRIEDVQEDFVKSKLYEVYSPHNKKLIKIIESCTEHIYKVGQFDNGVAVYERK